MAMLNNQMVHLKIQDHSPKMTVFNRTIMCQQLFSTGTKHIQSQFRDRKIRFQSHFPGVLCCLLSQKPLSFLPSLHVVKANGAGFTLQQWSSTPFFGQDFYPIALENDHWSFKLVGGSPIPKNLWLVVYLPLWKILVSWDDYSQWEGLSHILWKMKIMFETTNQ